MAAVNHIYSIYASSVLNSFIISHRTVAAVNHIYASSVLKSFPFLVKTESIIHYE